MNRSLLKMLSFFKINNLISNNNNRKKYLDLIENLIIRFISYTFLRYISSSEIAILELFGSDFLPCETWLGPGLLLVSSNLETNYRDEWRNEMKY